MAANRPGRVPRPGVPDEEEPKDENRLLNNHEAAHYLGFSTGKLFMLTAPRGPIPAIRIGSLVRYARADLDKAIEQFRVSGPANEL